LVYTIQRRYTQYKRDIYNIKAIYTIHRDIYNIKEIHNTKLIYYIHNTKRLNTIQRYRPRHNTKICGTSAEISPPPQTKNPDYVPDNGR